MLAVPGTACNSPRGCNRRRTDCLVLPTNRFSESQMSEARNAGQREVDLVAEDDAGRTTRDGRARDRYAFEDKPVGGNPKIIDDIAGRSLAGDEGVRDR